MEIPSASPPPSPALGKDMLREACGNLLIPYSLIVVALPSFLHQLTVAWESLRNSPSPYLVEILEA